MIVEIILRLIKLLNIVMMATPVYLYWIKVLSPMASVKYFFWGNLAIGLAYAVCYCTYARNYDVFRIAYTQLGELFYGQVLAVFFADCWAYGLFCLLSKKIFMPSGILMIFLVQIIIAVVWSQLARCFYFSVHEPMPTLVIYDQREGMEKLIGSYGLEKTFRVVNTVQIQEAVKCPELLNEMKAVFLSGVHSHERNIVLKECIRRNIYCYMVPRIGDVIMSGAMRMHMFHLPMMMVHRYNPNPEHTILKRIFDIISSGVVLLILSPFLLLAALAIKLYDGGPVFYTQKRLTKDGQVFDVYKFRSMRVDAEKDGVARLSSGEDDPRITPIGRIIRKFRIDEFPQLLNIIGGSMSVVGPRPERPEIAAEYEKTMPEFRLRLQAKAGLTGYAQVYGKYNTTPYDKLQMDLMYIAHPSFYEDLKIIFATFRILFVKASTEGVAEGQTTAMK